MGLCGDNNLQERMYYIRDLGLPASRVMVAVSFVGFIRPSNILKCPVDPVIVAHRRTLHP
jgi:hypothetical protein